MARLENIFKDPASVRPDYHWQINHSDESETGKQRNIEHAANTGNTGLVKQQNDDQPLTFEWTGAILHKAQLQEFIAWWELCESQTIHLWDFAGDKYEVIITGFKYQRKRTIRNPRDFANAPLWWWTYTINIEVIRVIEGIWAGVTP